MTSFLSPIFDLFGVDVKTQFIWAIMAYLAAFIVYAIRAPTHGPVFAAIFVVMGFSLFFLLFTESARVRQVGMVTFVITCAAAFAWHVHLRGAQARRK